MFNFLPPESQPLNNGQPMFVQSALCKNFVPAQNPFENYINAVNSLRPSGIDDYRLGFQTGYNALTSGLGWDVPTIEACNRILTARINKSASHNYGEGAMDCFRLFFENPLDIQKVIDRIGQ